MPPAKEHIVRRINFKKRHPPPWRQHPANLGQYRGNRNEISQGKPGHHHRRPSAAKRQTASIGLRQFSANRSTTRAEQHVASKIHPNHPSATLRCELTQISRATSKIKHG